MQKALTVVLRVLRREDKQHVEPVDDVRSQRIVREDRSPCCPICLCKDVHLERMERFATRAAEHGVSRIEPFVIHSAILKRQAGSCLARFASSIL